MAVLICTCRHSQDLHQYERARRAWTVCRACRCVRFTTQDADDPKKAMSDHAAVTRPTIDAGHVLIRQIAAPLDVLD